MDVLADSFSAEAGFQEGDLVQEVNGRRVLEANDLLMSLAASAAVQETQISFRRGESDLEVTLPRVLARDAIIPE